MFVDILLCGVEVQQIPYVRYSILGNDVFCKKVLYVRYCIYIYYVEWRYNKYNTPSNLGNDVFTKSTVHPVLCVEMCICGKAVKQVTYVHSF